MARKLTLLLVAVLALGLVAAGCGGDDDETTSTTSSTTTTGTSGASGATGAGGSPERAALIEEADAICTAGDKEIDEAAKEAFGDSQQEPSASDQEAFVEDTVVPNIQDQLDQLSDLDPPEADADEFQGIIDDAQSALDELADDPSVLTSGDDPFAEVNQRAQAFGLSACGGSGG